MSDSLFERPGRQVKQADPIPVGACIFQDMPYTRSCLMETVSPDGKIIKGCTLRIQLYLGWIQLCVTDEVNKKYAYLQLDPFKSFSEAIEEVLSSGSIDWRDSRGKRS